MNIATLPAGLLNDRIEFFNNPDDTEQAYYQTNGAVKRVHQAPRKIKSIIRADIKADPRRLAMLKKMGYKTTDAQLEKYISCMYGAYDKSADVIGGQFVQKEHWNCPKRETCIGAGILCNILTVGPDNLPLTKTEVRVFALNALGWQNKEIAYELNMAEETLKVHLSSIRRKSGLTNKQELVLLAHQTNII